MENTTSLLLRDQILLAFCRFPNTSIAICLRMAKKITNASKVDVTDVRKCITHLVQDGLLQETLRKNRLPPTYCITSSGLKICTEVQSFQFSKDEPLFGHLKSFEQKVLKDALQMELKFANDQQTVFNFIQQCIDQHRIQPSTLMIQDCLRKSTNENNIVYTQTVLAQLSYDNEIECTCKQMLWRIKRNNKEKKTTTTTTATPFIS